GVHGANRLASNSLLEGIVFATETAHSILSENKNITKIHYNVPMTHQYKTFLPEKRDIQQMMTQNVGIIRDKMGLLEAKSWFEYYLFGGEDSSPPSSIENIERLNLLTVGWLVTTSA